MKSILLVVTSMLVASVFSVTAMRQATPSSQPSIAYVSSKRILAESADGRAEATKFQAMAKQAAADLNAKREALEATRQQLSKAPEGAGRTQLQQREREQRAEFERETAKAKEQLQLSQREALGDLHGLLKPVLDEVARERHIQLILNADTSVVWSAANLDLTSAVIDRLNARSKATPPKN
jgi:Skp family chaperone for outer membrane proteins